MKKMMFAAAVFLVSVLALSAEGQPDAEAPGDLGGQEIRISAWWKLPQPGTELGDRMAAQIQKVEEKYNVKISWVEVASGDTVSRLTASVMAGDPMADMVHIEANKAIPSLAESGVIVPLDKFFNFEDPRWPHNMDSVGKYRDRTFGYFSINDSCHGIWYNKTLFQREGLPDLYELQEKGEWTWDKYLEIARKATRDTDGDGEIDQYGIAMGYPLVDHFIWSNGGEIVTYEKGKYLYAANRPESLEAMDFVGNLWKLGLVQRNGQGLFISGKAALYGGEAWDGEPFKKNMKDEVGFVFYPKGPRLDTYTSVTNNTVLRAFPANGKIPPRELAQIMMDFMDWDHINADKIAYLEENMSSMEDIDTALAMMEVNQLNNMYAFPGLSRIFWTALDKVKEGTSAATAVNESKQAAQATIDAVVKN